MRKGSLSDRRASDARGLRFGVAAALWNEDVTSRLLSGALDALTESGAAKGDIAVVRVPGSFELVSACRILAGRGVSAVIAVGCLLRGQTPHFEYLASSVAGALAWLNASQDVPVSFGVLTCDTRLQALARSGGRLGHAGREAAIAAITMARLAEQG